MSASPLVFMHPLAGPDPSGNKASASEGICRSGRRLGLGLRTDLMKSGLSHLVYFSWTPYRYRRSGIDMEANHVQLIRLISAQHSSVASACSHKEGLLTNCLHKDGAASMPLTCMGCPRRQGDPLPFLDTAQVTSRQVSGRVLAESLALAPCSLQKE